METKKNQTKAPFIRVNPFIAFNAAKNYGLTRSGFP